MYKVQALFCGVEELIDAIFCTLVKDHTEDLKLYDSASQTLILIEYFILNSMNLTRMAISRDKLYGRSEPSQSSETRKWS
jgi:hypothetical protein